MKIEKLQEIPFMFFDRYEIDIQAFLLSINGKLIIFNPHLHKNYFQNMYSNFHKKRQNGKRETKRTNEQMIPRTYIFFENVRNV